MLWEAHGCASSDRGAWPSCGLSRPRIPGPCALASCQSHQPNGSKPHVALLLPVPLGASHCPKAFDYNSFVSAPRPYLPSSGRAYRAVLPLIWLETLTDTRQQGLPIQEDLVVEKIHCTQLHHRACPPCLRAPSAEWNPFSRTSRGNPNSLYPIRSPLSTLGCSPRIAPSCFGSLARELGQ